jgi:hypothetical protein
VPALLLAASPHPHHIRRRLFPLSSARRQRRPSSTARADLARALHLSRLSQVPSERPLATTDDNEKGLELVVIVMFLVPAATSCSASPPVPPCWPCSSAFNTNKGVVWLASILCHRPLRGGEDIPCTTRATCFPECLKHSGKWQKHSGKPSPSATLGEGLPGKRLTGKSSSPSAKNRTLGEGFPESHGSTRGRFNTVDRIFLKKLFPECNTRGRNFFFFLKSLPRVQHSGKKFIFLENVFPECLMPLHSGKLPLFF